MTRVYRQRDAFRKAGLGMIATSFWRKRATIFANCISLLRAQMSDIGHVPLCQTQGDTGRVTSLLHPPSPFV